MGVLIVGLESFVCSPFPPRLLTFVNSEACTPTIPYIPLINNGINLKRDGVGN